MVRPLALALAAALVLAGCGGGPSTPRLDDLDPQEASVCTALLAALPDSVGDLPRAETETGSAAAAYGDPAVRVTCGVGVPDGFDRFSACQLTNGVGWFVPEEQITDRPTEITLTAVGYRPRVQVVVPADYWPAGAASAMVELGPAVRSALELVQRCR